MAIGKFNQGMNTSDDVNRQYRDEFVSKAVVEVAETLNKRYFSNRSNKENMKKNHGKKFSKMMHYPLINKDNMSELNMDAASADIVKNVFYTVNTDWVVQAKFDVMDYITVTAAAGAVVAITQPEVDKVLLGTGTDAEVDVILGKARGNAKVAAEAAKGAGEKVVAGAGLIRNGQAPYSVNSGSLAPLPEEGGVVNLLNGTSKLISASITKHGIGTIWTMESQDFTAWPKAINRKIKEISEAQLDIKELQVQYDLLDAATTNSSVATVDTYAAATDIADLGPANTVSFEALEAFQQELMENDVPTDTTIISGTKNIDTRVVEEAYIVNVNRELLPALRRIKGVDGTSAFIAPAKYLAGSEVKLKGEVGAIDGLQFRFVVTPDLLVYKGQGLSTTIADDAAAQAVGTINKADFDTKATRAYKTNGKFDVFNMLVIGDDSFSCLGFQDGSQNAAYIPPVKDVHNDMHGELAGVSTKWYHGTIVYRPERVRRLLVTSFR